MKPFETLTDAVNYAARHDAGHVRVIGGCNVCKSPCAATVRAEWEIQSDLFSRHTLIREPAERPTVDPCGHNARWWSPVRVERNMGETCGDGCRSATSSTCSCSCEGLNHGLRYAPRS